MTNRMRGCAGLAALAGLLASGPAWAERPVERAARRKQTEQQVAKVEERLAEARVEGRVAEVQLDLARRQAELARKLLEKRNERAAQALLEQAERFLALAEGQEEQK